MLYFSSELKRQDNVLYQWQIFTSCIVKFHQQSSLILIGKSVFYVPTFKGSEPQENKQG